MKRHAERQFGRADLPPEQHAALKRAIRWEIFTMCYTAVTITTVAFVVGNSQAMRTAWIEDMLSLAPQAAFLIAMIFVRRRPTCKHPYGLHRAMGVGHLVAGVALLVIGLNLSAESVLGLINAEHPTIGTVKLLGHTIWLGWLMIAVMAVVVVGPVFIYGPAKAKLAPVLHNKLLYADADMAKADWHTNAASIIGVLGIGMGLWWLDGVAAILISVGIVRDGWRNTKGAVLDLMDQRATTHDDKEPDPLAGRIVALMRSRRWVTDAGVRLRDLGQVFQVEAFVVPARGKMQQNKIDQLSEAIAALDWKVQDVVVVPVSSLPEEADDGRED